MGPPGALVARVLAGPGDLPTPSESADEARRRAVEILARPELRPPPKTLLQRLFGFLGEILGSLLDAGGGNVLVAWAVVAVAGALALAVVVLVGRALQRDPGGGAGVGVDEVGRPPSTWRAEAAQHERTGAWRDALRCHWRALVAELAVRGLVEEVPGRTTGEYRRHVERSVPGAARAFGEATSLFEVAWYAAQDVGERDVADERRLADAVLAEAGR